MRGNSRSNQRFGVTHTVDCYARVTLARNDKIDMCSPNGATLKLLAIAVQNEFTAFVGCMLAVNFDYNSVQLPD